MGNAKKSPSSRNRRNDARMDLGPWSYKITLINALRKEERVLLQNISLGGIGIISKNSISENEEVLFTLDKKGSHFFKGRVKWSERLPNGTFKIGVQFEISGDKELEIIKDTVTHIFMGMPKEFVVLKAIELFTSGQVLTSELRMQEIQHLLMKEDFQNFVKNFKVKIDGSLQEVADSKDGFMEILYKLYLLKSDLENFKDSVEEKYH